MDDGSCSSNGIKPKQRSVKGNQYNKKAKSLIILNAQGVCAKVEVELTLSILLGVQ